MRKLTSMLVSFLVVACGGTSPEALTASSQVASARGGNSAWVLTTVDVPPGDFVFPLNALGEYKREFVSFTCSAKP